MDMWLKSPIIKARYDNGGYTASEMFRIKKCDHEQIEVQKEKVQCKGCPLSWTLFKAATVVKTSKILTEPKNLTAFA
jgi:hypothetical protein